MTNWNYAMKESKEKKDLVLINQNTKNEDYKVESVDSENKILEASGLISSVKSINFPFSRIDNISEDLLTEHFAESYI